MRQTPPTPLFPWDAGWLYLLAGLVIVAAATIVPAQRDLAEVDAQLRELQAKEQYCCDRLAAYSGFLDQWQRLPDDMLVRLASAQLNQRPQGDRPVVLASNVSSAVTDWIDSKVAYEPPVVADPPQSILSRLSGGRGQLWMLAAGALAIFVGLVLGPTASRADLLEEHDSDEPDHSPVDECQSQPGGDVTAYDKDMLIEYLPGDDALKPQTSVAARFAEDDISFGDDDDYEEDAPTFFYNAPVLGDEPDHGDTNSADIEDGVAAIVTADDDDAAAVAIRDAAEEDDPEEDEDGEEWDDDEDEEWDDDDEEYEDEDEEPDDDAVDDEEVDEDDDDEFEDDEEDDEDGDEEWDDEDEDDDDLFADDDEDEEDEWEEDEDDEDEDTA